MTKIEIIKHYQAIVACTQFILTGSTALQFHGLVDSSSDIDIILINPTKECEDMFLRLEEKSGKKIGYKSRVSYIFEHEGFKIDIFIEKEKVDCCYYQGIPINPIKRIIDAKKKSARPKDFAQLRKMAASIITDKEILDYISTKA
jgi:hypothetical protein